MCWRWMPSARAASALFPMGLRQPARDEDALQLPGRLVEWQAEQMPEIRPGRR
jgi:hypothetical protein